MTEIIGWLALLVVAPLCVLFAIWLIYRVVTKAPWSRSLTRRQVAWMAALFVVTACMEASIGISLLHLLPPDEFPFVWLVQMASFPAMVVVVCGFIDALIPGIWWWLLPWWLPLWLRPRQRQDATPDE